MALARNRNANSSFATETDLNLGRIQLWIGAVVLVWDSYRSDSNLRRIVIRRTALAEEVVECFSEAPDDAGEDQHGCDDENDRPTVRRSKHQRNPERGDRNSNVRQIESCSA